MDDLKRLLAWQEICELKARYCRLMDQKKWSDWEDLFTSDAVLVTSGTTTEGAHEIRDMVETAMTGIPSSHQAFLPEITFTSDTTAEGVWAAMFIQSEGRTTGVGHYFEQYRTDGETWRISRCELVTSFVEGTAVSNHLLES